MDGFYSIAAYEREDSGKAEKGGYESLMQLASTGVECCLPHEFYIRSAGAYIDLTEMEMHSISPVLRFSCRQATDCFLFRRKVSDVRPPKLSLSYGTPYSHPGQILEARFREQFCY